MIFVWYVIFCLPLFTMNMVLIQTSFSHKKVLLYLQELLWNISFESWEIKPDQLIKTDRNGKKYTVNQIAKFIRFSSGIVFKIFREHWGVKKVFAMRFTTFCMIKKQIKTKGTLNSTRVSKQVLSKCNLPLINICLQALFLQFFILIYSINNINENNKWL